MVGWNASWHEAAEGADEVTILFLTLSSFSQFPTYKRAVGTGEALALLGHRVLIAALDCEENRTRMAKEAPHCEVIWFSQCGVLREVWMKFRAIWRIRPDVVYSTSYSPHNLSFLGRLLPHKTCKVLEFCELYSQYSDKSHFVWKLKERIACWENDRILCASKLLEDHFRPFARKVLYSPYAYPGYLMPVKTEHPKTVVFMAALWRGYGAYDVPEACIKLFSKYPDLQVEIMGRGPEKDNLRKLMAERGVSDRVHVRGYVADEELNDYFSLADVFVAPLHGTIQDKARCPSKIFYYIPYNKPIVTCALGDPLETLGENGFYYKPDDIDDMSRAIDRALAASDSFSYPKGFIESHSWMVRAKQFEKWIEE